MKTQIDQARASVVEKILDTQRMIKTQRYEQWVISTYWGQIPTADPEGVKRLGYCAYAISNAVDDSAQPNLSSGCGTQVIIGPKSVIIWSSSSEEDLDRKIKETFKHFEWRNSL